MEAEEAEAVGGRRRRGHALVVPYPCQGHINPAFQLAKHLANNHGFLVSFLNTTHNHERILASQTHSNNHHSIRLLSIPDGLPSHLTTPDLSLLSSSILHTMPPLFHDLLLHLTSPHADPPLSCIFSDILMLFTQDAATHFRLPRIAFWLQSSASFSINLHVPLLIQHRHMPFTQNDLRLISCIPGHPPFPPQDLPSFFQVPDLSDFMIRFKTQPFHRLHDAAFVLINSFDYLEPSVLAALRRQIPNILTAGPLLPPALLHHEPYSSPESKTTGSALWPDDNRCLDWLDKQKRCSVLYISFGSIATLSSVQFGELCKGLEASQQPLLWAIRPDLMDSIASALPESFKNGKQEDIYLTSWVPQQLVLAHPSVGGFLTHCGWNSTLESVSMGVPMLAWPYFADQMLNRKWIVEEWKIGKEFEAGEDGMVSKEEIEMKVRLLMEGDEGKEMRQRAKRLGEEAHKAMKNGGSSYKNLENVVQMLIQL